MISSQDGSGRRSQKTLRVRAFCICRARPHSHLHHADHIKWQTDPGSQMAALDQTSSILKELQSDVRSASRPQTTGASSVVVGHPLDTVKTRLQAGKGYRSTLHCILTIYKKETVAGFFKGMSFPLASITVYNSAVFGFFSNTQRLISNYRYGDGWHPCSMLDLTVASMLTGLMSVGLGAPVDLVKIRLQMQTQMVLAENLHFAGNVSNGTNIPLRSVSIPSQQLYRGPIHCISSILQTEGLQGLYRGAGAMILRDVPGYTLYFIPYAIFCDLLRPDAASSPHPCSILMAGGLAAELTEPNDGAHSYTEGADRQFPTLSAESRSPG